MYGILMVMTLFGVATGCPQEAVARAAAPVSVSYPEALKNALAIVTKIERALDGEAALDWARLESDLRKASAAVGDYQRVHPEDLGARLLHVRLGRILVLVQPVPVTVDSSGVRVGGRSDRHLDLHAELDRILAEAPVLAEALYLKARLYATQQPVIDERGVTTEANWAASRDCAGAALGLVPSDRRYRNLYALGLARSGTPDSALAVLKHGGLEESLLGRLWRDFSRIPVPTGATRDARTEATTAEMMGSQIGPYWTERVRAYSVPMEAADLQTFYRARWPSFSWIRFDGDEELAMQFLRFRRNDFEPVGSEKQGEKLAQRGEGVMLMTLVPEAAPGSEEATDRVLILVNYRRE